LLKFASTLFDRPFDEDAFIGETRLEPTQVLANTLLAERYPNEAGPWPQPGESVEAHIASCAKAWLPVEACEAILAPTSIDRVKLGHWVGRLPIIRAILLAASARPVTAEEAIKAVAAELSSSTPACFAYARSTGLAGRGAAYHSRMTNGHVSGWLLMFAFICGATGCSCEPGNPGTGGGANGGSEARGGGTSSFGDGGGGGTTSFGTGGSGGMNVDVCKVSETVSAS